MKGANSIYIYTKSILMRLQNCMFERLLLILAQFIPSMWCMDGFLIYVRVSLLEGTNLDKVRSPLIIIFIRNPKKYYPVANFEMQV